MPKDEAKTTPPRPATPPIAYFWFVFIQLATISSSDGRLRTPETVADRLQISRRHPAECRANATLRSSRTVVPFWRSFLPFWRSVVRGHAQARRTVRISPDVSPKRDSSTLPRPIFRIGDHLLRNGDHLVRIGDLLFDTLQVRCPPAGSGGGGTQP